MSNRSYPERNEIISGQAGKQTAINVVIAERPLVLREPQISKPGRDVNARHARLPAAGAASASVFFLPQTEGRVIAVRELQPPSRSCLKGLGQ